LDPDAINVVKEATNRNAQVVNYVNKMIEKHHLSALDDNFIPYGHGVVAYFKLVRNLIKRMLYFSIFAFLQVYWFTDFPTTLN
jgi:hypothetical protein